MNSKKWNKNQKYEQWNTKICFTVFAAVILLACFVNISAITTSRTNNLKGATTAHAPIYIEGNADFTSGNGVSSGNGTQADPYIIENWDINASKGNGVEIRNTDAYFIIRNCVIHDGDNGSDKKTHSNPLYQCN